MNCPGRYTRCATVPQSVRRRGPLGRLLRSAILLLVVWGSVLATPSWAQNARNPEQELERTDRILERARDQVGVSPSNRAGGLLSQAIEMQVRAKRLYSRRERETWGPALRLTLQARDLARRAIETAEIEAKAHESIRDLIDSTRDLAQDASTLLRDRNDAEAQRLLEGGLWQLQRAQEAYRGLAYRKAIRLAVTARDMVQRAIERARGGAPGSGPSIEAAIDRTQGLIEELRVSLEGSSNERAQRLYEQALRLQQGALRMQREGKPLLARRSTTQARQAALEGLLTLADHPDDEDVERAISAVEQLIQDTAPVIMDSGSAEAVNLLDLARQRHAEATEQLAKGNAAQAMATARIAEGLLRRAAEVAGDR
jgi:hypothetical protein